MKKHIILWLLILVLSILVTSCQINFSDFIETAQREPIAVSTQENITPTPSPTATATPQSLSMVEVSRHEESEEFDYTIQMLHPQLENGGESGEAFNEFMNTKMLETVNEFRDFAEERYNQMNEFGGISYYELNYSLYQFDEDIISVQFLISTYYIGAAHPGTQHFVVNYDLKNNREITLGDLFLPDSQILRLLQYYCAAELSAEFPEGYFENGLEPLMKNYEDWNLSSSGLVLTFEEYQVQAYAAGPQTIIIPFEVLMPYIDPAGPIGYLTQQDSDAITF